MFFDDFGPSASIYMGPAASGMACRRSARDFIDVVMDVPRIQNPIHNPKKLCSSTLCTIGFNRITLTLVENSQNRNFGASNAFSVVFWDVDDVVSRLQLENDDMMFKS